MIVPRQRNDVGWATTVERSPCAPALSALDPATARQNRSLFCDSGPCTTGQGTRAGAPAGDAGDSAGTADVDEPRSGCCTSQSSHSAQTASSSAMWRATRCSWSIAPLRTIGAARGANIASVCRSSGVGSTRLLNAFAPLESSMKKFAVPEFLRGVVLGLGSGSALGVEQGISACPAF